MSPETDYWRRILRERISRRRALQAAALGGVGLAGATVIGCGGGKEEGGGGATVTPEARQGGPQEVINPQEQTPPTTGGFARYAWTSDPLSLDPQRNLSWTTDYFVSGGAYSRLYKFQTGPGISPTSYLPTPDVAESYEETPDHLTWTFKLRPDVKWQNKPPLNGRALVAGDVVATYKRFIEGSGPQPQPARYAIVLQEIVDSVEAPDDSTVVFNLKVPYPWFLNTVSSASYLWILSQEAVNGDIDPAKDSGVIGTGPWILDRYEPSKKADWIKNPDYFVSRDGIQVPYMDGFTLNIVPEYATQKAQFQASNLDYIPTQPKDVLEIANTVSGVQITRGALANLLNFIFFGQAEPNPFKDERVRRAVSMALDRDALLEVVYNISTLRNAGYEPVEAWHNIVPAGLTNWWLDPKSHDMSTAGQWYDYDPAQAKALLSAAGFPDGLDADFHFATAIYGGDFETAAEATPAMLRDAGIRPNVIADAYGEYITTVFPGKEVSGIVFALETIFSEVDEYLWHMYNPQGARNHTGWDDPQLTQMIENQRIEADEDARRAIIYDIQRYVSDRMYYVPATVGGSSTYGSYQRWDRNVGVFTGASFAVWSETTPYLWLSEDAPGRKA